MKRTTTAPVFAMPAALVLALLTVCAALPGYIRGMAVQEAAIDAVDRRRLDALDEITPRAAGRPLRVVSLSHSVLGQALHDPEGLGDLAWQEHGLDLAMVKVVARRWSWDAVVAATLASEPDVVVLEKRFLFSRLNPLHFHWKRLRIEFYRPVRALLTRGGAPPDELRPRVEEAARETSLGVVTAADLFLHARMIWDGPRPELRDLLEQCRLRAVPVLLVDVPARNALSEEYATAVDQHARDLAEAGLLRYVPCPLRLDERMYVDWIHLDEMGRSPYSRWLISVLVEYRRP